MECDSNSSIYKISYSRSTVASFNETKTNSIQNNFRPTGSFSIRNKMSSSFTDQKNYRRANSLPRLKNLNNNNEASSSNKKCIIKKKISHSEVVKMDPNEYIHKYGLDNLVKSSDLPKFVKDIQPPLGIELAANCKKKDKTCEFYGDVFALDLVDLDKEGLSEYNKTKTNSELVKNKKKSSTTSGLTCGLWCSLISVMSSRSSKNKHISIKHKSRYLKKF